MSFSSNYNELRKKRKKADEKETGYTSLKFANDDIAPLNLNRLPGDQNNSALDRYDNVRSSLVRRSVLSKAEEEKQAKKEGVGSWFKASELFDDGYQFGDVTKAILGTQTDLGEELTEGAMEVGEKAIDFGAAIVGTVGGWFGAKDFRDETDEFIKKDLYNSEKLIKGAGKYIGYSGLLNLMGTDTEKASVMGEKSEGLANSAGQLILTAGISPVVPWYVTSGVTSFGGEAENALNQGATHNEAMISASVAAATEILTEKLFGGSGLGEKGLVNTNALTKGISSKFVKSLADYGVDLATEGAEEVVAEFAGNFASALYKEENLSELLFSEEAVDSYIDAFVGGMALSGGMNAGKVTNSIKTGRDYRTGLTSNEQKVFDKELANRIAEAEKDGNKLSKKDKAALYDEVMDHLEKGYISTDTIEEVLGGDSYKTYKDTVDSEDAKIKQLEDQLKELEGAPNTVGNSKKYDSLQSQLEELKNNSQRNRLKAQLSKDVYELTKGDKLVESYFEKVRANQKFEADLNQYTGRARDVIQKVMDSGLVDNTNRTHEFWDWAAKMSDTMDTDITLANDEQILELIKAEYEADGTEFDASKFDGQRIDGYVSKNGIVLNAQSNRALNFVVGHEITHKLEGTKHYAKLQELLFEYAKDEYESRFKERSGQYSNKFKADDKYKTKVDQEVTGDLVGDYIFNDKGFIDHLAKDQNVFQQVWNEIKHMAKIATAGSEQAKQLEKAKREFERAFREAQKNNVADDTKFSLENSNNRKYNKRSRYSETETLFLSWENGSAPVGEVKKFVRYGKIHYYEKTDNGCVELSRSQYNERNVAYVENIDRRAERETGEAYDYDESTQRGTPRHSDGYRDTSGTAAVFGQAFSEELQYDTEGSVPSALGYGSRTDIKQSEYNDEASDDSGASFVTFSNDYSTIRNFMKDGDVSEDNNDPDIRFSLSESVEGTKDLVALHNLTADKLSKSLELGGLPMPSLAITKADIPHSNFGEITLIFGRETIDPKANKKNKAYSADAWTPVFPRVEYEADSKVANRVSQKLRDIGDKIDGHFQRDLNRVNHGFENYLNSDGGEEGLIQRVMDNYGMKAAYLEEQGKHIEAVTTQQEAEKNFNPDSADKYQKVMDILGVTTAEEVGKVNLKDAIDNHGDELETVYPGMTKTSMRMGRLLGVVKSYIESKDAAPVYNTVVDNAATQKAVDDALDAEGYEAWVRNLFSGIVKDSGIYNNKDIFTPSGNRRSFKQTHLPFTLENIVKAMASQNNGNSKNVSGFNGIKTLRAATAETFKSVDEMHQRKGRLQNRTQEEADALNNALQDRLFRVMETIDNESGQIGDRNPYIRLDSIGEVLAEIGESGKYGVADIQRVFKEYSRNISDDTAMEVKQLLYDVVQMPVNIFESKPQRVVGFDEAKVFVIPRNADVKLKQELLNRGYSIAEYDPDVEGDRQKVVNQFEEYQFSLSNIGEQHKDTGGYQYYSHIPNSNNGTAPVQETAPVIEKPVSEDVAPVAENTETSESVSKMENVAPVADMFPDNAQNLDSLLKEQSEIRSALEYAASQNDIDTVNRLLPEYEAVSEKVSEMQNAESDRLASLDDADAPPEMDAPYYGEPQKPVTPDDPFADRDWNQVGNQKVKAFIDENPTLKPFFQDEARAILMELADTTKGERWYNDQLYYESGGEKGFGGVKRHTSDSIAELLDSWGMSYAEIEKGLNEIIEDSPRKSAAAKKIEFMLNDRLLNGYKDYYTNRMVSPNKEYVNLLNQMQTVEYSPESFDSLIANADEYAPPVDDIAPVTKKQPMGVPIEDLAPTYDIEGKKGVPDGQQSFLQDEGEQKKLTRSELHKGIVDDIKSIFSISGYDFDKVLRKAKNLSTFSTVDNTPQRVMEKALGYKEGSVLADLTVNKVAQNETEGIKWLNSFTDRKNGLLAKISKQYNIKPGSKESAAAQMYAEGFYVNENNEIIQYGDAELAKDFPNATVQKNIKNLAGDSRIRQIYDDTLAMINESRTRNAYPEIPRLDNYFLHFRAMEDTFSKLGLPFNPNDIRAKDLPTDLNGVTADLKPGQPYFASAMHRTGKRTSFDLLGGLERYLSSAKNQIYHIDDIQTFRALRNYIADTYGQANGLEGLDALSEEEAQDRIEKVYNSHLSTFAKFLNEEANILAGKTALIDRGLEGIIGRRGITFLDTVNKQVGSNMVGMNVSSSLTNFLPVVQTFAKTNKFDFTKAFAQTVANKVGSVFGKNDGFAESSPVIIRRKGADRFYRTPWQKAGDAGYVFMSAVDDISTELIARTKYNELTRKGMDSEQAHIETDKWVSRLMGDRSIGQMPQLYNSKMLGLFTKFQLEVRNQLDSQFYDTIQEAKVSNEDIRNGLARNAKTAAKVGSTFLQLAVAQHLFGKAFESVAGYNPAFDIVSVLLTAFGFDDEEDSDDTALDNIEQGFLELLGDLPYTSTLTGGRIPISSALPVEQFITGKDQYGNEKSRWDTLKEVAPYYVLPGGYGQIKKTAQGLDMFSEDHPIAGSYTDSGKLRFPVEDTIGNRVQAGIFGQWASENARDYFDNERKALTEEQTQEFIDLDIPIQDYWEYREGLSGLSTLAEKADYIMSLDLPLEKKNLLINNLSDREEPIDLEGYEEYGSFEDFDFAQKYPEKYDFLNEHNISVSEYNSFDNETKEAYTWASKNPEKYVLSQAVSDDFLTYYKYRGELNDIRADKDSNGDTIVGSAKEKKLDYINNLDLEYGQKIILFKSLYNADDTYNYEIVDYLNSREDISYKEMETILKELGFDVSSDGTITWD